VVTKSLPALSAMRWPPMAMVMISWRVLEQQWRHPSALRCTGGIGQRSWRRRCITYVPRHRPKTGWNCVKILYDKSSPGKLSFAGPNRQNALHAAVLRHMLASFLFPTYKLCSQTCPLFRNIAIYSFLQLSIMHLICTKKICCTIYN
jgi:hypothetical protein